MAGQNQLPPTIIVGQPTDDPGCNLTGHWYVPDPVKFPGPTYPVIAGTRAGGFTDGGLVQLDAPFKTLSAAGFLCLSYDVRLVKGPSGQGGIPGQTTTGKYHQQTDDAKLAIKFARADPRCNGFVGTLGGSGSGHHALYCAMSGTVGVDKSDAAVGLSPVTDFSSRSSDVTQPFINQSAAYADLPSTDLTNLRARSPIALVSTSASPIFQVNGDHENMPISQLNLLEAAMATAGVTNYANMRLTGNEGGTHAFALWKFNDVATACTNFLLDAVSKWNGGAGGGSKPKPTGFYALLSAPDGNIGNISGRAFLDNQYMDGARIRVRWENVQPTSPTYDWSLIDNALLALTNKGKKAGISIAGGCCYPAWSKTTAPTFNTIPLSADDQTVDNRPDVAAIWESGYLTKFKAMIMAAGAKYDNNPFVSYIVLTGFIQNVALQYLNDDADMAAGNTLAVADGFADLYSAWLPAAKGIIDTFMVAFPKTPVIVTIDRPFTDTNGLGTQARNDILSYGRNTYGDHFGTMYSNLQATLPPHDPPGSQQIATYPKGWQPIHSASYPGDYQGDQPDPYPDQATVLGDLLGHAYSTGGNYVEPYMSDVEDTDPNVQQQFALWRPFFVPQAPPPPPAPTITSPLTAAGVIGQTFQYQTTADNDPTSWGADATALATLGLIVNPTTGLVSGSFLGTLTEGDYSLPVSASNANGTGTATVVITLTKPAGGGGGGGIGTGGGGDTGGGGGTTTVVTRTPILFYTTAGRPPVGKTRPNAPTNLFVDVPTDPTILTAPVSWDAPAFDGGSPITDYKFYLNPDAGGKVDQDPDGLTGTLSSIPVGLSVALSVTAINKYGESDQSYPFTVKFPVANPPPPLYSEPRGVYRVLYSTGTGLPDWQTATFWNKSYIDGSIYEIPWALIEPTFVKGAPTRTYVLDDLNAYLAQCATFGKKAILIIDSGIFAPTWFKKIAGQSNNFSETGPNAGSMAFPWVQSTYFTKMVKDISAFYVNNSSITAVVATGFGQTATTVLTNNSTDTDKVTMGATAAGFDSAVSAWIQAGNSCANTFNSAFSNHYTVAIPEKPVPDGTPVKDGSLGLILLENLILSQIGQRVGFCARGFTSISNITTDKEVGIVSNDSGNRIAAGFRFKTLSTDPGLDPTQTINYNALTGFQNAITHAVSLKAKWIEVYPEDADNANSGYVTTMTNAQTSLATNP